MDYSVFLSDLDKKLSKYFDMHKKHICCLVGCSSCCEKGDYPMSQAELEYLMRGFISLDDKCKIQVQNNIKNIEIGGACPFLIDKKCSVYQYRPIICRVHGLAYLCRENTVKVPYCVYENKNYAQVYKNGEIVIAPITENLDTIQIAENYNLGEVRNLTEWLMK